MKIWPLFLGTLLFSSILNTTYGSTTSLNRIVAVVNEGVITETELESRLSIVQQQISQRGTLPPPQDKLRLQVLERLVSDTLQLQLAESTGIRIDDETLNKAVSQIASSNNLSLDEFRQTLERDGFSFAMFREDIRSEIIMRRLHERHVIQRIHVSGTEVDQFLLDEAEKTSGNKEYRLSHILIALPEAPSPQQITQAQTETQQILNDLQQGGDFVQLAISHSDGQQAFEGGDLGWRKGNQLPTLFANIVPRLQKGENSDAIRGPNGFHIIQVADIRGGDQHIANQTLARHILIKTNTLVDDSAASSRLADYRQQILAGADFATLAKEHSEDLGSASKGGDLGWANPGDMVPRFEAAMNALQPGEISQPFKSNFGWHIVEVLDRRKQDVTEEVKRRQAHQILHQRKIEEDTESWLLRLRDEAFVDIRLD